MANKTVKTRIQHKREFEIDWNNSSLVPLQGELIVYLKEVDSSGNILKRANGTTPELPNGRTTRFAYDRFKVGDGYSTVNELDFIGTLTGTADPDANTQSQYYFKYSL